VTYSCIEGEGRSRASGTSTAIRCSFVWGNGRTVVLLGNLVVSRTSGTLAPERRPRGTVGSKATTTCNPALPASTPAPLRARQRPTSRVMAVLAATASTIGAYEFGQCPANFPKFQRGNANADARIDIADAIYLLSHLFAHGPAPSCKDSGDANDDGAWTLPTRLRS